MWFGRKRKANVSEQAVWNGWGNRELSFLLRGHKEPLARTHMVRFTGVKVQGVLAGSHAQDWPTDRHLELTGHYHEDPWTWFEKLPVGGSIGIGALDGDLGFCELSYYEGEPPAPGRPQPKHPTITFHLSVPREQELERLERLMMSALGIPGSRVWMNIRFALVGIQSVGYKDLPISSLSELVRSEECASSIRFPVEWFHVGIEVGQKMPS